MSGEKHVEQAWSPSFTDEVNELLDDPARPSYLRKRISDMITAKPTAWLHTHNIEEKLRDCFDFFAEDSDKKKRLTEEEVQMLVGVIQARRAEFLKSKGLNDAEVAKAMGFNIKKPSDWSQSDWEKECQIFEVPHSNVDVDPFNNAGDFDVGFKWSDIEVMATVEKGGKSISWSALGVPDYKTLRNMLSAIAVNICFNLNRQINLYGHAGSRTPAFIEKQGGQYRNERPAPELKKKIDEALEKAKSEGLTGELNRLVKDVIERYVMNLMQKEPWRIKEAEDKNEIEVKFVGVRPEYGELVKIK